MRGTAPLTCYSGGSRGDSFEIPSELVDVFQARTGAALMKWRPRPVCGKLPVDSEV